MTDDEYDTRGLFEVFDLADSEPEGSPIPGIEDVFEPEFLQEIRARLAERPESVNELLRGPWRVFERFSDQEGECWVVVRSSEDPLTAKPAGVFQERTRAYVLAALLSAYHEMPVHKVEREGDVYAIREQTPGGWKTIGHVHHPDENVLRTFRALCAISKSQQALAQMAEGAGRPVSNPASRPLKDDLEKPN